MAQNVVIRKPNPGQGQGDMRAISQRTGWEYEHDETDEQIDRIEEIILGVREEEAVQMGDPFHKRGVTFSWTSTTDSGEGNILLAMAYRQADGLWAQETWNIRSDGTVED